MQLTLVRRRISGNMNGVIDLSFDDEVSVHGGVRTDVISLIDDSQGAVDGDSSTALRGDYSTTSSVSTVQSRKRRRASKNSVTRSSANNVNKSSLKKRISDSQKKKIEEANKAVEKISEEVKTLREKLASAEKELKAAVKTKLKANTNDTLGGDGSMSIENANVLDSLKETLSCSICLDSYSQSNNIWTTGCGHLYHKRCIELCLTSGHRKCPLCKKPISKSKLHPIWI